MAYQQQMYMQQQQQAQVYGQQQYGQQQQQRRRQTGYADESTSLAQTDCSSTDHANKIFGGVFDGGAVPVVLEPGRNILKVRLNFSCLSAYCFLLFYIAQNLLPRTSPRPECVSSPLLVVPFLPHLPLCLFLLASPCFAFALAVAL